jgi:hypothetical protein
MTLKNLQLHINNIQNTFWFQIEMWSVLSSNIFTSPNFGKPFRPQKRHVTMLEKLALLVLF